MLMNQFDFTIKYKKGEDNCVADALSRNPVAALTDSSGSLVEAQQKDDFCRDVRHYLENGDLPDHDKGYRKKVERVGKGAKLIGDVIYYWNAQDGRRPVYAALLPQCLWRTVTEAAHNSWLGGHGGEDRTVQRIFLRYYFPGVHTYVAKYIKSCPVCQAAKGKHPPPMPLQSLPICDGKNERVHIDLFGPLRTSEEGNKYVMVMTDAWSKVVELAAIPDKTAEAVARTFFERWICRYSVPLLVISDNGKEFANNLFTKLMELLGSKQSKTTAYHPATNSSAESFNRSMKKYLRAMLLNNETLEWEPMLPMLQMSYNCHVHRSTLESPFWLTYHMDPRLPYFDLENPKPLYSEDYATAAFKAFSEAHKLVHKNQWDAREVREAYYNRKSKERSFDVGDRVMFFKNAVPQGVNEKFYKQWQGPYYVIKKVSPLNYVIQKSPKDKELLVHVEKIKHLSEEDIKKCADSKNKIPSFDDIISAKFDVQNEDGAQKHDQFVPQSMQLISHEEAAKSADTVKDDTDLALRATRSRVKAGEAKLVEGIK
jgi:transposase InsO family protein